MKSEIVVATLFAVLLSACTGPAASLPPAATSTAAASTAASATPEANIPTAAPPSTATAFTANTGCADDNTYSIGGSIASSYSFTSAEEVLTWFCNGANLEDIVAALETEELTDLPTEDLLRLRADGLSWEAIWDVSGLNDR